MSDTYELGDEGAFGFHDHSWGVRQAVGAAPTDLIRSTRENRVPHPRGMMKWTPSFFRRPDGSYYEAAINTTGGAWNRTSAYVNEADGSQALVRSAEPRMQYDPRTRFVRGGELL